MAERILSVSPRWGQGERLPNGFTSTFSGDFAIAEDIDGRAGVVDTFKRSFAAYRRDIRYMTTLAIATNRKAWEAHERGDGELSDLYGKLYYIVRDYVYGDESKFTEQERRYFFDSTD